MLLSDSNLCMLFWSVLRQVNSYKCLSPPKGRSGCWPTSEVTGRKFQKGSWGWGLSSGGLPSHFAKKQYASWHGNLEKLQPLCEYRYTWRLSLFLLSLIFINFRIKIFLMTISCILLSCFFSFFRVIAAVKCVWWHLFICMKEWKSILFMNSRY